MSSSAKEDSEKSTNYFYNKSLIHSAIYLKKIKNDLPNSKLKERLIVPNNLTRLLLFI